MASICNDERGRFGVLSGHDRKTLSLSVLFIPWIFEDLAFRVGNPGALDVAMGSMLILLLLEATRRSMGWPPPIIASGFMAYAMAGPVFSGLLTQLARSRLLRPAAARPSAGPSG